MPPARSVAYGTLAGVAAAAPLAHLVGPPALTAALGVPAVLLVPGAALIGFLDVDDPLDELLLVLATSLVLVILGTQALLWSDLWYPAALLVVTTLSGLVLARHAIVARGDDDAQVTAP